MIRAGLVALQAHGRARRPPPARGERPGRPPGSPHALRRLPPARPPREPAPGRGGHARPAARRGHRRDAARDHDREAAGGARGGGAGAARRPRHARRAPRAGAAGAGGLLRPRARRGDRGGAPVLREGAEGPGRRLGLPARPHAGDRWLGRDGHRGARRARRPAGPAPVDRRRAGGPGSPEGGGPGRHRLYRGGRPRAQRPEVHPARASATSATGSSAPSARR